MNIGEVIKKLRKQKDMTQEQLAEYLNITTQAISKWETNLALPDITLVPALANIFGVSADVLLGIDIEAKENRIKDIIKRVYQVSQKYGFDYEKGAEILRAGLKEYPNSYEIMVELMLCVNSIRYDSQGKDDETILLLLNEVIYLGEKVLAECTNDRYRYRAIRELCSAYSAPIIGKFDKAKELAEKMPRFSEGREFLLKSIYQGEEKLNRMQENMGQCLVSLVGIIYNYIFEIFRYDGTINSYNDYTFRRWYSSLQKIYFFNLINVGKRRLPILRTVYGKYKYKNG